MRIHLHTRREKERWDEYRQAREYCREIKACYEKTKGIHNPKDSQVTNIPIIVWNLIEKILNDKKIKIKN